jgi:alkylation response protein AidB-like acyl-CoA dehydrogenase
LNTAGIKERPEMSEPTLHDWLATHAESLDTTAERAEALLPQLARDGLIGLGVPVAMGGQGGDLGDALCAIAGLAERSLTAAFMGWSQRAFIELLLQTPNAALRERLLPELLAGRLAGAPGLSNAMKFVSGLESLQVRGEEQADGRWCLDGVLPWVSNLRGEGFVAAGAMASTAGGPPQVWVLPHDAEGLSRSVDFELLGMQASHTARLELDAVRLAPAWRLHDTAPAYLPGVRPNFLGLQCALALGLAQRCLQEAEANMGGAEAVLGEPLAATGAELAERRTLLLDGLRDGRFREDPVTLCELRIRLVELAQQALQLELQASGGRAFLSEFNADFARRWREAAFLPVITPSLVQLKGELGRKRMACQ